MFVLGVVCYLLVQVVSCSAHISTPLGSEVSQSQDTETGKIALHIARQRVVLMLKLAPCKDSQWKYSKVLTTCYTQQCLCLTPYPTTTELYPLSLTSLYTN